jgi:hypothetical protein
MSKNRLLIVLPLLLIAAAAIFRYLKLSQLVHVPALENFAPWMALAFTGTLVISQRVPFFALPLLLALIDLAATGGATPDPTACRCPVDLLCRRR